MVAASRFVSALPDKMIKSHIAHGPPRPIFI